METLVAIFYIASEAQGSEISLAIEGWRKHFKEPHRIVVVGDKPPVDDVDWLQIKRVQKKDGEYLPALDICQKLEAVCLANWWKYDGFIWASDDFFAVNDFTLADVMVPKIYDSQLPSKGDQTQNAFWHTQIKTRRLCEASGAGVANWTTHLPMWFDIDLLYWLIQDYDLTEMSYIVENLYYNMHAPEQKPERLHRNDRWKFDVCYSPLDRAGLSDAFIHKIWVCCSVNGWCPELEAELRKHYGM